MFALRFLLASVVGALPFEEFQARFGKQYAPAELEMRRNIYNKNLAMIEEHNKYYEAGRSLYYKAVNQFSDMTAKEQAMFRGGKNFKLRNSADNPCGASKLDYSSLPDMVDYRNNTNPTVLTPVKNQGQCGSCWAFATTETVEAAAAIASGKDALELSPQEVTSCTQNPNNCGGTGGCNGATAELGFNQVMQSGLCSNADWPYTQQTGTCDTQCTAQVGITGCAMLPSNNYTDLMYAVAQIGPIAVSVDASQWSAYGGGIYTGCSQEKAYEIDHAVQLVGYGSENGQNYWIVRNSWGTSWGENGYIRVQRLDPNDSGACKWDFVPQDGVACEGEDAPVTVCGECGIWYDSSYPTGAYLMN